MATGRDGQASRDGSCWTSCLRASYVKNAPCPQLHGMEYRPVLHVAKPMCVFALSSCVAVPLQVQDGACVHAPPLELS